MSHRSDVGPRLDTHFDTTVCVTPSHGRSREDGVFTADLDESWASLRGIHGGYLAALAIRAAEATAPDRMPRTIATTFLRPAQVGPAQLSVEALRSGRSFTTVVVSLTQQQRAITNTRVTMIGVVPGHDWASSPMDRPAPVETCVPFTPPPMIRHFDNAELRIDPSTIPVGDGSFARIAGHVRPNERRPVDAAWLAMIGDWFPPSPFRRFDPPIGGVSIDYTVHLHSVPIATPTQGGGGVDDGWLEGVFVTRTSAAGIALEQGTIASSTGALIAETFHTRWTG